jgi:hypothetical protein
MACERAPDAALGLASQPTLSRLENLAGWRALARMGLRMIDLFCDVFAKSAAAQNAGARLKAEWLADHAAPRAGEPTSPAGPFKIRSTRRVVGENTLKFRQRLRKRQICADQNIHGQHYP